MSASGQPHLVPVVFAVCVVGEREVIYSGVDRKPKRTAALRRLANIEANPSVCLLADHYEEDWTELWWARADGQARILDAGSDEARRARNQLAERYAPYRKEAPPGPFVAIDVLAWSGWSAGGRHLGP